MRAARWLAFVFAAPLASPQDAPALASIQGQVIDAATGAPVRKASITLRQPRKDIATATSDASGAFVFPQAVPGEYRLIVRARGYLTLTRDTAIRPLHSGTAFSAAAGQKLTGLVLRLTPGAALSGRIADEDDDPVAGVLVQLWSITYRRGRRELSANPDARATTDERGIFRIGGVAPGRHFLSATYPDTPQEAFRYVRTFYPGTLDPAAAAPLDLTPGADLENINVKISKVQTVRVAGRVLSTVPSNVLLYPEGVISSNDAV
ncbi:MAG: carboxypeptidase-like regulatory domain-containing protein, partial [Bryobacteraceae bacterium]